MVKIQRLLVMGMAVGLAGAKTFTLLEAVETAIAHNLSLQQQELAYENQKTALELSEVQFYGVFPVFNFSYTDAKGQERSESVRAEAVQKFSFGGSLKFSSSTSHTAFPLLYSTSASATFSYPFGEAGGRRFTLLGLQTARLTFQQNQIDLWLSQQDTISGAVSAYLSAWQAKQNLEIQKDTLKQSGILLDLNKTKYELGLLAEPDYLRAQVSYETSQVSVLAAERAYRNALENLAQFLGFPPSTPVEVVEELTFLLPEAPEEASILQKVMVQNPTLRKLSYQEEIQKLNLFSSRRRIRPEGSFDLTYSLNSSGTTFDVGSRLDTYNLSATVSFRLPLRTTVEVLQYEQAKRSYESFEIGLEDTRRTVQKTVSQRVRAIKEALDRLKILEKSLENARKSFELIEESYREGLASILDYQSEQQRLAQTRLQYVNARVDVLNSFIALQRDIGEDALTFLRSVFTPGG